MCIAASVQTSGPEPQFLADVRSAVQETQREAALLSKSPDDNAAAIRLKKNAETLPGLSVSDMTSDQVNGVKQVLEDLLMPFRNEDRNESIKLIEKAGFDDLHLSFYNDEDIAQDGVWDN